MDKYIKGKVLGHGQFGSVVKATVKETGQEVAIKKVRLVQAKEGIHVTALREIKVLKELHHPHVIELVDVFISSSQNLSIVLELMESDLEAVITDSSLVLSPADVKSYMQMALKGLDACHSHKVVHRDIKPNNLLTAKSGLLKLADFGLAKIYSSPPGCRTSQVFARWYRAPELLWGSTSYGPAVDVWAMGCVFAELMLRRPWFVADSDIKQLQTIFSVLGTPTAEQWKGMSDLPSYVQFSPSPAIPLRSIFPQAHDDALDLLSTMMQFNPSERITTKQALKHRFFTSGVQPTPPDRLPKPKSRIDAPLGAPQDGQPGTVVSPGNRPALAERDRLANPDTEACRAHACSIDPGTAVVDCIHAQHWGKAWTSVTSSPACASPAISSPWHQLSSSDESSNEIDCNRAPKRRKSFSVSGCLKGQLQPSMVLHADATEKQSLSGAPLCRAAHSIRGSPLGMSTAGSYGHGSGLIMACEPRADENTSSINGVSPCPLQLRHTECGHARAEESERGRDRSQAVRLTPNLLIGTATSKATPQLWGAQPEAGGQSSFPLATRSPNIGALSDLGSMLQKAPANSWQAAGVCPGALGTAESSLPLYTLPDGHVESKAAVPTPVKDTVRKNLFGA